MHVLFIACPLAKYVWSVVQCAFDLRDIPGIVRELSEEWPRKFPKKGQGLMAVGVSAILWTIWKTRNDACFRRKMDRL